MAQENRIQDGTVVFSTADPSLYDLGFNIKGNANVTKALVVSQSNENDGRISSSAGTDLILTVQPGATANIRLEPPTGGNVLINNVAWLSNTPDLGGFIGASSANTLHYYPFVAGNVVSDTLTFSQLNSTYPNITPGQMIVGSSVVYLNVGLGTWRVLSNGGPGGSGTVSSVAVSGGTTGLTTSGGPITANGTITLAGTLGIANGGTGQTTANASLNALLPSQGSNTNKFLRTDGTNSSWVSATPQFQRIVASASQTVFNTSIPTVALVGTTLHTKVAVNGLIQVEGVAYTVTGANQITFSAGLALNDDVQIYYFP